ncbi:hypothetical protein [Spirochaeta dissipatitropha]
MAESSAILGDVVQRENISLNPKEQEVMSLILRKFVCNHLGNIFQEVRPEIAITVKKARSLQELKPLFPLLHRAIRENWITDSSFFDIGWQDFIELSKKTYLQLNPRTRISQIRPGFLVKNITKANFYGMMLTMDYCTMSIHSEGFERIYPFALKYFTLSFERNPDEVLKEFRFFNQNMVTEVFLGLMNRIGSAAKDPALTLLREFNRLELGVKTPDQLKSTFEYIKKLFYVSMIHNYAIIKTGRKTSVGYVNDRHELLSWDDPGVQQGFRQISTEESWTLDKPSTQMAMQVNQSRMQAGESNPSLLPNFIRAVLESVRSEALLTGNSSPLKSRKVKQGMDRELQPKKYYSAVIEFLQENQSMIKQILTKYGDNT